MVTDSGGDLTVQGVAYGRRTVKMFFTYPVIVSTLEEELFVRKWLTGEPLNWRKPNITDHPDGKRWVLNFTYTEVIADTDRGDEVSYRREWRVKDAT